MSNLLKKIQSQAVLFANPPSRLLLQQLENIDSIFFRNVTVNVWRNHNFEILEDLAQPYLQYAGLQTQFTLSDYDSSLAFSNWQQADLELIWLDSSFYEEQSSQEKWLSWLQQRVAVLRLKTTAPIIVITWNSWATVQLSCELLKEQGAFLVDLNSISQQRNTPLIDQRTNQFAGTPVSRKIQPILARYLACHWICGILLPPIKALALDLDNTLHAGVLGEDGMGGVSLDNGFKEVQQLAIELKKQGVFLILVSRNEHQDVEKLFLERKDYPLKWNDFSVIKVSWGSKAEAIQQAANELNIATDAILFIDDNIGELNNVARQCPEVHLIHAESAQSTLTALTYYPSLWRWQRTRDDALRVADLKANQLRNELKNSQYSEAEYFKSLETKLTIKFDDKDNIIRLAELSGKTNQFNLSLSRYNQAQLQQFMQSTKATVVSVALADKLSDSGAIAIIVAELEENILVVKELCISCRALGRELENDIILTAIINTKLFQQCGQVKFLYNEGPRNQPAKKWLDTAVEKFSDTKEKTLDVHQLRAYLPTEGLLLAIGESK